MKLTPLNLFIGALVILKLCGVLPLTWWQVVGVSAVAAVVMVALLLPTVMRKW